MSLCFIRAPAVTRTASYSEYVHREGRGTRDPEASIKKYTQVLINGIWKRGENGGRERDGRRTERAEQRPLKYQYLCASRVGGRRNQE
ncbi:hypothetical protein NPIL_590361 [Nephila pilipes]|uniref:Uncharacterized protein n=1 Tax=Nephila pilipes TaxID=299642 RepID=A0A8X6NQR2_NEPPI|nr:hypothetical protein NPIL_590361 [Nephila pilipes]